VGKALAIVYYDCPIFLFFPMVGEFHGFPVGDMQQFVLPEYAIEHPGRAEQAHMASV
jgi:hypothetical protein